MKNAFSARLWSWYVLLIGWLLTTGLAASAQPSWEWAQQGNATATSQVNDLATDAGNNLYVGGQFTGTMPWGGPLSTGGPTDYDGVLLKLNAVGTVLWAVPVSGTGTATIRQVAVDGSGAVWVAGSLKGINTFGSTSGAGQTVVGPTDNSFFVARYSATGALQWVTFGGNNLSVQPTGLATSATNGAYLVGNFSGSIAINGNTLTSAGNNDILLLGLSAGGSYTTVARLGGAANETANDLVCRSNDEVVVCGHFTGSVGNIAGSTIGNNWPASSQGLLFCIDVPNWTVRYADTYGGAGWESFSSVAVAPSGQLYASGTFTSASLGLSVSSMTRTGINDSFVAGFNPTTGWEQWATKMGGAATCSVVNQRLSVDAGGNVLALGSVNESASFGTLPVTLAPGNAIYVARFSSGGTTQWARTISGAVDPRALTTDGTGAVLTGGGIQQTAVFGNTALTSPTTAADGFVARLGGNPPPTYCVPGNFSGCGTAPITRVQITGTTLDNASTCQNNGFGNAFAEYPASGTATGTMQQGLSYQFGVTSSSSATTLAAWADWNQNGTFESSEFIAVTGGASANVPMLSWITVPANAVLGQTKMRVRSRASNSTINSTDACTSFASGESEDYIITIAAAPPPTSAYCTPGNFTSNCNSAVISRVQITGTTLNNTSTCQVNNFGNAYTVFQPTGSATGTVQQGISYTFGITTPNSASTLAAWADWNQNGTFESSEFIAVTGGASANVAMQTWITVPTNAVLGQTTLRIRSRASNSTINSTDACAFFGSGETEDYTITVGTAPPPTSAYCTPGNFTSNCNSAVISRVQITGTTLNNTSTCQVNSFGNAYTVFQPTGSATGTVQQGISYTFGITTPNSSSTLAAWADWNQNGTFESSEFIAVTGGASANVAMQTWITVPTNAVLGQTTLRIRSRASNSTINSTDACAFFGSGETEDYTITVGTAPPPTSAYCTPGNFTSNCNSAVISRVQITGTTLNNTSTCQVNNFGNAYTVFQPTGSATGTVQQGVSYTFGITTPNSSSTLAAWADWNQNGTFESSEFIAVTGGASANVAMLTWITVPTNAVLGQTTLRIRSRASNSTINSTDACAFFGSGETEDYTIAVAAAPNPAPVYCTPGNFTSNCANPNITQVQLTGSGLLNNSTCQVNANGNSYVQYPASGSTLGSVQPGTTYALRVNTSSSATVMAWADWNRNNIFDTNEAVTVLSGSTTGSVGLSVPAAAVTGQTTLRVRSRNGSISSFDACSFFGSGETEDYVLQVGNCALAAPTISTGGALCAGATLQLTATGVPAGATYQWSGPGFSSTQPSPQIPNVQAANSGTYTLTITQNNCSATSNGLTVAVNPLPPVSIQPSRSPALCQGESVTLTANGASSYVWSTGAQTASITVSTAGTYTVTGTSAATCQATSAPVTVTVSARPTATITAGGPTTFCQGGSVTLTASAGTSYLWSTGAQTPSITVSTGGQYTVTVTNAANCSATSTPATVTVNPPLSAAFSYASSTYCRTGANPLPTITGTSGGTFSATPAGLSLNASTGQITLTSSAVGAYTVTYSVAGTCPATQSQTITLTSAPLATFSYPAGTPCAGSAVTLVPAFGTGAAGGVFSATPAGLSFNSATGVIDVAGSAAGTYTITNSIAASGGCAAASASATVTLSAAPTATITAGGPTSFCQGGSVTLTAASGGAGAGYQWLLNGGPITGATNRSYVANQAGSYTVTVTSAANCSATSAPTVVTVNALPSAAFSYSSSTFCLGGANPTPTITGLAGGRFLATPSGQLVINMFTGVINLATSPAGTYTVSYTADNGQCSATQSQTITLTAAPSAAFSYPAGTPCAGSAVTLVPTFGTGAAGGVFSATPAGLSFNPATGIIDVASSAAGTYTITNSIAASGGCAAASASASVTLSAAPTATITAGGPTSFCQGGSVTLTAANGGAGGSYQWLLNGGLISGATNRSYVANQAGSYTVAVTSAANCSATSAPTVVTVNALPSAAFSYSSSTFCLGGSNPTPTITGLAGGRFLATPSGQLVINMFTGVINLATSPAGTYTVSYTADNGQCSATQSQTITLTAAPSAAFSYPAGTPCAGSAVTLVPTFGTGAAGGVFSATPAGLSFNPATGIIDVATSAAGTYTVTNSIAASGGCAAASASASVTLSAAPTATITAGGPTSFCQGGSVTLTAANGGAGGSYQWLLNGGPISGATNRSYVANQAGSYTVTVTSAANCSATSAPTVVTVNALPSAAFSYSSSTFCLGGSNPTPTITGLAGGRFLATPSGQLVINMFTGVINLATSPAGTYTVSYTADNGQCSATQSQTITLTSAPLAAFSYPAGQYCAGAPGTVVPTFGTGASAGSFSATPAGLTINPTTGVVDLSTSVGGLYTITNSIAASGACPAASATATLTLQGGTLATFAYSASTYCLSGTNPVPTIFGTPGGTFSATPAGLSLNAATGQVNLAASSAGTYTITYAVTGTCPASGTQTLTLTTAPSASFTYPYPNGVCAGAGSPAIVVLNGGAVAGTFTAAPAGLVFLDPATGWVDLAQTTPGTYTITNTVAAGSGCASAVATATLTVLPAGTTPSITSQPQSGGSVLLTASAGTSYQWFLNGQPIAGATSQTYLVATATQSGTYTVSVFTGTCPGVSAPLTVTVTATPAELSAATVQLFPNPTTGLATLTFPAQPTALKLEIQDATGRILMQSDVMARTGEVALDLRLLPTGVYVLHLHTDRQVITRRLTRE